jgi:hypothetical protein
MRAYDLGGTTMGLNFGNNDLSASESSDTMFTTRTSARTMPTTLVPPLGEACW